MTLTTAVGIVTLVLLTFTAFTMIFWDYAAACRHSSVSTVLKGNAMADNNDEEEKEDHTIKEEATCIPHAKHYEERRKIALDILSHVPPLREIAREDAVCDDQVIKLYEAIDALREAADDVWPEDDGIPQLDELADYREDDGGE